jgi:hypothetical protein
MRLHLVFEPSKQPRAVQAYFGCKAAGGTKLMMNPKLREAVDIFKELGWEDVTPENVLQLPLGSTEQKRKALAGLKSGEWGEFAKLNENTYGWRSFVDVDEGKLGLFAVRIGVDARKATGVLRGSVDFQIKREKNITIFW